MPHLQQRLVSVTWPDKWSHNKMNWKLDHFGPRFQNGNSTPDFLVQNLRTMWLVQPFIFWKLNNPFSNIFCNRVFGFRINTVVIWITDYFTNLMVKSSLKWPRVFCKTTFLWGLQLMNALAWSKQFCFMSSFRMGVQIV